MVPILISGTRVNVSLLLTLALSAAAWVFMQKSFTGYKLQVGGLAPRAAGYAGFNEGWAIWLSLLIGGFAAGLAGAAEVAGPLGQLQRSISTGYGGPLHRGGQCHGIGKPADRCGPRLPGQPAARLPHRCRFRAAPSRMAPSGRPEPVMNAIEFILAGMLGAATPFLLAALGELVAERAGVLNLGVEGLMAFGAVLAFIIVYHGGGHFLGFVAAGLGSAVLSLVFAVVALGFRANQVATGLAIGILGQGLSALFGKTYESLTVKGLPKLAFPWLSEIPVLGSLFIQDIVVWLSLAATLALWGMFAYTKAGLVVRAVGENPKAAHAIGYSVTSVRVFAIAFGGAMAGFAGAYAAVVYTPLWADGMIAGRGWIAIALVVFGTWLTGRIFLGACLFGAVSLMGLAAQATGLDVPSQLLSSLPYLVTIIVLGIISADRRLLKLNGVASLGEPFER
jgi:simple sugar transport system permease protein